MDELIVFQPDELPLGKDIEKLNENVFATVASFYPCNSSLGKIVPVRSLLRGLYSKNSSHQNSK
jgi:hypothetical protein